MIEVARCVMATRIEGKTRPANFDLGLPNESSQEHEDAPSCNDSHSEEKCSDKDVVSPLEKEYHADFSSTHTRKRSVLKRDDRSRKPSSSQKRVSFSSGPSERRVSNGKQFILNFSSIFYFSGFT